MRLYLLKPLNSDAFIDRFPSFKEGQTWGAVVAAPNETSARQVASEAGGDAWLDRNLTDCEEIKASEYIVPCLILDEPAWGKPTEDWSRDDD